MQAFQVLQKSLYATIFKNKCHGLITSDLGEVIVCWIETPVKILVYSQHSVDRSSRALSSRPAWATVSSFHCLVISVVHASVGDTEAEELNIAFLTPAWETEMGCSHRAVPAAEKRW